MTTDRDITEPVILLHTGAIYGGERDEYDIEPYHGAGLEAFCDAHPGETVRFVPESVADALRAEVEAFKAGSERLMLAGAALRAEVAAERARADMHADLGRRTAEALGLDPSDGRSDMPERVRALRAEVARLTEERTKLCELLTNANRDRQALRADAERLDSRRIRLTVFGEWGPEPTEFRDIDLRAAIDAARAREASPIAAFMAQQAEASRPLRPGEPCPDCDGTGTAGGQFAGGYWPCERCGATGAGTQEADR